MPNVVFLVKASAGYMVHLHEITAVACDMLFHIALSRDSVALVSMVKSSLTHTVLRLLTPKVFFFLRLDSKSDEQMQSERHLASNCYVEGSI